MKTRFTFRFLLALGVIFVAACGQKKSIDLSTTLKESRGIEAGTSVLWQGQVVGKVMSVTPEEGQVTADIDLIESYESFFRYGLAASTVGGTSSHQKSTLNLYGGADRSQPLLTPGSMIPEALPRQTFYSNQLYWVMAGVVLLAGLILIVKTITFVVKLSLAAALCAAAFFYASVVWERHGQDLVPEIFSAQVDQFLAAHEIPEHLDVWMETIKADAQATTERAKEHGLGAGEVMVQSVKDRVRQKMDEVGESTETGRLLRKFMDQL